MKITLSEGLGRGRISSSSGPPLEAVSTGPRDIDRRLRSEGSVERSSAGRIITRLEGTAENADPRKTSSAGASNLRATGLAMPPREFPWVSSVDDVFIEEGHPPILVYKINEINNQIMISPKIIQICIFQHFIEPPWNSITLCGWPFCPGSICRTCDL